MYCYPEAQSNICPKAGRLQLCDTIEGRSLASESYIPSFHSTTYCNRECWECQKINSKSTGGVPWKAYFFLERSEVCGRGPFFGLEFTKWTKFQDKSCLTMAFQVHAWFRPAKPPSSVFITYSCGMPRLTMLYIMSTSLFVDVPTVTLLPYI